jgi:chaperonin GroES
VSERGSFVTQYFYCRDCLAATHRVLMAMDLEAVTIIAATGGGEVVPLIIAGKAVAMYAGGERHTFENATPKLEAAICHPVTIAVIPDSAEPTVFEYHPHQEQEEKLDTPQKVLRPIHDKVHVRLADPDTVTASGLLIPEKAQDKLPQFAAVLAVGTGRVLKSGAVVPLDVQVDDRVLLDRYRGQVINDELKELIVAEHEILCVLEGSDASS